MCNLIFLYEQKKYIIILEYIKNLDDQVLLERNIEEIKILLKILLKYEYEEVALLIYNKIYKIHEKLSKSIINKMFEIENFFKEINYECSKKYSTLKTTSAIVAQIISLKKNRTKFYGNKKILLVVNSLGPGGAERQFVNLFNFLSKYYASSSVCIYGLVLSIEKKNANHYLNSIDPRFIKNINIYDFSTIEEKYKINFGSNARKSNISKIRKSINENNINIAIGFLEESSVSVCLAALIEDIIGMTRFGSMPTNIARNLGDDSEIKYKNRIQFFKNIDEEKIIWGANSRKCLAKYLACIDFKNKKNSIKTAIIPNIVDMPALDGYKDKRFEEIIKDKIVIISIMRLSIEKRPNYYLDLVRHYFKDKSLIFILIGAGPLKSEVESVSVAYSNLFWIENTTNISYYLSASHIYVMTSITEGSPNAVMEASFFGLPAVVANIGGVSEIYTDKVNAIFVNDFRKIDAYVLALDQLIKSKNLRIQIGTSAQKLIKKRHSGFSSAVAVELATNKYFAEA